MTLLRTSGPLLLPNKLTIVGTVGLMHGIYATRFGPMNPTERRIANADK